MEKSINPTEIQEPFHTQMGLSQTPTRLELGPGIERKGSFYRCTSHIYFYFALRDSKPPALFLPQNSGYVHGTGR